MNTIGFIGLGAMGEPMAQNLIDRGCELSLYDVENAKLQRFAKSGARLCDNAGQVAEGVEILLLMVLNAEQVESVLFGPQGAVSQLQEGSCVVSCTTTSPASARDFASRLADRGIGFIDAPVSGGRGGAEKAQLAIMVGAEVCDFERVQPLLAHLGTATLVGPVGSGQAAKAANQILVSLNRAAVGEAFALARACGVDPEQVRQALAGGLADSPTLRNYGARMAVVEQPVRFDSPILAKDMQNIAKMAEELNTELPFAQLLAEKYRQNR